MIFVALAVLVLAALVGLGRKPLMAHGRRDATPPSAWPRVAIAAAAWDAMRGGWLGGSILASAALWLVTSASRPAARRASAAWGCAEAAAMLGVAESAGRGDDRGGLPPADVPRASRPRRRGGPGRAAQRGAGAAMLKAALRALRAALAEQPISEAATAEQALLASASVKPVKTAR